MKDSLSRDIYAQKIVEEIVNRYDSEKKAFDKKISKTRENIIFAMSGRWGEGKTGLLDLMEPMLENQGYKVIKFNPWKYSQEDITLKRAFLRTVRDKIKSKVSLDNLYYDRTKTTINWAEIWKDIIKKQGLFNRDFLLYLLILISVLIIIDHPLSSVINFAKTFASLPLVIAFFTLLLIPIFIKTITTNKRSANVTTAEEFEDIFNELLKNQKKIVIFIDDLDRCTPKTVKVILDSLKTFFLHPECSYVITGDHTIIEEYAGGELQLDEKDGKNKRLEEGRRFLKKLFDVYWRVPLPTPYQFKNFVKNEIDSSKINFPSDLCLENFTYFLTNDDFFGRNLRQTKRFITKLRFALESVKLQIGEIEKELKIGEKDGLLESKKSLEKILNNPDLLAKVLLIEEFFYPLYEWLVVHPELLIEHEKSIRRRTISQEIVFDDKTKSLLEADKIILYDTLVGSNPKFTNEDNSVIHEVSNYFLFSGSTGLPSNLGPDESNFVEYIKNGQLNEKLGDSLEGGTTVSKNKIFAQKALQIFDETPDTEEAQKTERINILTESIKLCAKINEWATKLPDWEDRLYTFPAENQKEISKLLFEAALKKRPHTLLSVKQKHPELLPTLWEIIPSLKKEQWNEKTQDLLFEIVKDNIQPDTLNLKSAEVYLSTDPEKNLDSEILENLSDPDICRSYLAKLKEENLLDGKLIILIKNKLSKYLEDIKNLDWASENKELLKELGIFSNLQTHLMNLYPTLDKNNFLKMLSLRDQLEFTDDVKLKFEQEVLNRIKKTKDFSFLDDEITKTFLTPKTKKEIFKQILQLIKNRGDLKQKQNYCKTLLKTNNFWGNLDKSEIATELEEVKKASEKKGQKLLQEYNEVLNSWQ